jgi:predicted dehydrogenase
MVISIALIGLGPGAQPHAKSLHDLANRVRVKAAASRTEARTRVFADRFGFPVTTDVDAVIADPSIQAVIVLTPPAAHLEIAERCLRAGKHVLVEKPLELTVPRGEQLVRAARQAGRTLGVVLQHRFRPASLRLGRSSQPGNWVRSRRPGRWCRGGVRRPTTTSPDADRWRATAGACC